MASVATKTLDCRGMQCPAPILHIATAARGVGTVPAVIEVLVDDGDFPRDVEAWCRTSKSILLALDDEGGGLMRARIGLNGATESAIMPAVARAVTTANDNSQGSESAPSQELDCRGLRCPAPILRIAKAAKALAGAPGTLRVLADDPEFTADLKAWSKTSGAHLALLETNDGVTVASLALNGAGSPRQAKAGLNPPPPPSSRPASASLRRAAPSLQPAPAVGDDMVRSLDLRGMSAPDPIVKLSGLVSQRPVGDWLVVADDPGFVVDIVSWAGATKVQLKSVHQQDGLTTVELRFGTPSKVPPPSALSTALVPVASPAPPTQDYIDGGQISESMLLVADDEVPKRHNRCTMLIMRNDFETLMAALLAATSAAAQGTEVVMFYSLWGVNVLRGERPRRGAPKSEASFLQRVMKWMMPKGPKRQKLGKMHMGGMGTGMMQYFMAKNNVMTIQELIDSAVEQRVRFVVCTMSMGIIGIEKRDLMELPNIEFAGMASFVELSQGSSSTLVF